MRTNKNCPKYGEDLEAHVETADPEKAPVKIKPLDPSSQTQQKTKPKKDQTTIVFIHQNINYLLKEYNRLLIKDY